MEEEIKVEIEVIDGCPSKWGYPQFVIIVWIEKDRFINSIVANGYGIDTDFYLTKEAAEEITKAIQEIAICPNVRVVGYRGERDPRRSINFLTQENSFEMKNEYGDKIKIEKGIKCPFRWVYFSLKEYKAIEFSKALKSAVAILQMEKNKLE